MEADEMRAVLSTIIAVLGVALCSAQTLSSEPRSLAFLGVHLQNDNEMYEPTSKAELDRLVKTERTFKNSLASVGYRFVDVNSDLKKRIKDGQTPGECGGCELAYGKELGAEQVAWITVQKVSNLILNMNVYMADVATNKMTFVKSVDIRGNSDESWERSISYLMRNYLLPSISDRTQ
jgi:hypothetical protein